jgi:hypothetical protein
VGDGWYVSLKQQPVLPFILISSFMQLCVFDADLDVFVFIFFRKRAKIAKCTTTKNT